ncbi:MAG: TerB family tellurite resistance protein [Sandaracinaceae bacterium]
MREATMDEHALPDLSNAELIVLAGLLRLMMMADHVVTNEELSSVDRIGRTLGLTDSGWSEIWEQAAEDLADADDVRAAAASLARPAAREAVYEMLYRLADSDSIADEEWDLLEWLDETWLSS